jgi:DNA-binding XRE family transcriptional regulator
MGLRELRADQALSQRELAAKAGISKTTLVNIEVGRITPHPTTIRKLAAALGMSPRDLVRALRENRDEAGAQTWAA